MEEKKETFELIDVSGDVGLRAFGDDIKTAFKNIAIGLYSLITDISKICEEKEIRVNITADSIDNLIISWLNELIYQFDTYGFIGKSILINELDENKINAVIKGEEFNPEKHERKLLVKAATYHKLRIEKINNKWEIDVIFDI